MYVEREVCMLRIIFMGTPQFAVPALEALSAGTAPGAVLPQGYQLVTVITRVDKPAGRGKEIIYSPVKQAALAHGIPVWQPGSLKRPENIEALAAYQADLYIVAAFGQILPQAVLDQPRIMLIDAGVDTGPVLLRRSLPIAADETAGGLTARLATLGAQTLLEALPLWIAGSITPEPQDELKASHTRMLRKEDGEILWERPAAVLAREVRAYNPWPSAYTYWRGKILKIVAAHPSALEPGSQVAPGTVSLWEEAGHQLLAVVTGAGRLVVERLQLEGKKVMSAEEFVRGYPQIAGDVLGGS